jgi:hypothetical protein
MCSLFISVWFYTLDKLEMDEMLAASDWYWFGEHFWQ